MKILLVEDDPGIAEVLVFSLQAAGHEVVSVSRGRDAVAKAARFECVLLDIGLPDLDGFEVCRQIRRVSDVPVVFLTSRSDEIDRVVGLELGADDYVTKPFSTRELLARIKAVTRRVNAALPANPGLVIDADRRTVAADGRNISLSRIEFELLTALASQPGRVFTRENLLDRAWPDGGLVTDRTVDAHIKSLRRKLGSPAWIETVRGVGYRLAEKSE